MILFGDLLGAQMLLDRHREVRSAFDGGIVGDDQHFAIADAPYAGDNACTRSRLGIATRLISVHIPCGKGGEFEEWRIGVEQAFDPFTDEEFALLFLSLAILFPAPFTDFGEALLEFIREGAVVGGVGFEVFAIGVDVGGERFHGREVESRK